MLGSRVPDKLKALQKVRRAKVLTGDRLRSIREEKNLSQGDIEKRTGLLRCYVSQMPRSTSRRQKTTFCFRRKLLLRRRRMRNRSSKVRKPSPRRTSRPVNGTRLLAPSQSSTG